MSGDDCGSILAKHGVLPHARDRESSAGAGAHRRHVAMMKTRDAAIALLQVVQGDLDALKAQLGPQKYEHGAMADAIHAAVLERTGTTYESAASVSLGQIEMIVKAADRSGNERVTWEEMLSFMIDAGMKGKSADHHDSYKGFTEQVCYNTSKMGSVTSFRYVPDLNMILACQRSATIQWIAPGNDYAPSDKPLLTRDANTVGNAPLVLSYDYFIAAKCVAVSYADLSLCLFELRNSKLASTVKTETSTTAVRCLNGALYTGDRDGGITLWSVKRVTPPSEGGEYTSSNSRAGNIPLGSVPTLVVSKKLTPHTAPVTDIIWIETQGCLVSASLDKTITILSPSGSIVRCLQTPECNPISGLAYSPEANALVSTGACCQVFVWHVSNSSSCHPFVLEDGDKPHMGGLCGIIALPDARAATADARGAIKIWCLSTFRCLETLQASSSSQLAQGVRGRLHPPLHTMLWSERQRHIIVANNSRGWLFEYDTISTSVGLRQSAHDTAVSALHFVPGENTIITCGGDTVRVWSVRTGAQLTKYILPYEITSFAVTEDNTHFITGSPSGDLRVYNLSSGTHIRTLERRHETDITCMTLCEGKKAVFSTSWDGAVWLQTLDEDRHPSAVKAQKPADPGHPRSPSQDELFWSPESGKQKASGRAAPRGERGGDGARCVAYSPALGLCAVGGDSDTVTTWGTHRGRTISIKMKATLRPEESARNPTAAALREISALTFVGDLPVLAAGNSAGRVHLFSLPPYTYPHHCISWWNIGASPKPGTVAHQAGVTALVHVSIDPSTILLYAADDDGCVSCFNVGPVLEEYGMIHEGPESHGITPTTSASGSTSGSAVSSPASSPPAREAPASKKHAHIYPNPSKHIVHQVRKWRAHAGGIVTMTAIPKHNMLATSGVDRQVTLWTMNGVLVGSLDQNGKGVYAAVQAPMNLNATMGAMQGCDIPEEHLRPKGYEARLHALREPSTPPTDEASAREEEEKLNLSFPAVVKFQSKFKLSSRRGGRGSAGVNCGASLCSGATVKSRKPGDGGSLRAPSCFGGDAHSVLDDSASIATGRLAPLKLNFEGAEAPPKRASSSLHQLQASLRPSADMMSSICPSEKAPSRKSLGTRLGSAGTSRTKLPALAPKSSTWAESEGASSPKKSARMSVASGARFGARERMSVAGSKKSAATGTTVSVFATPGRPSLRSALKRPPVAKSLPTDYLSMLTKNAGDSEAQPSLLTTNDDRAVAAVPQDATADPPSGSDLLLLPPGSLEYRAGLLSHRDTVHVELTNHVTGLSQVVVMKPGARKQQQPRIPVSAAA